MDESHLDAGKHHWARSRGDRRMTALRKNCAHSPGLQMARTSFPGANGRKERDTHRQSPHFQETRVKGGDAGERGTLVPVQSDVSIRGGGPNPTVSHGQGGGYDAKSLGERQNRTALARRGTANAPIHRRDHGTHGSLDQKVGRPAHRMSLPRRTPKSGPTRAD